MAELAQDTRIAQAAVLADAGSLDAAIALYRRVLAERPRHLPALRGLGRAFLSRGDFSAGLAVLETVCHAFPGDLAGHRDLVQAYLMLGMRDEARDEVARLRRYREEQIAS